GGNTRLGFAKNIDDLFVGKTLLHGVVLMLLMKTLLTSSCVNQWGAGHAKPVSRGKNMGSLSIEAIAVPSLT
ncbi:hypothetical protein AAHA48_01340, partial [Dickeya oryzae]|uniref:hypothetical protein n=1 Tax=Dickeya oryzae TaxID=1240404 RepID=UPI00316A46D0